MTSRFAERFFTLDLKRNADFGATREIYTLNCRLISYGTVKESRNFLITSGGLGEKGNIQQWTSLSKLLQDEIILLFSYDRLRPFFAGGEYDEFVVRKSKSSLELIRLCELFFPMEEFASLPALDIWLNGMLGYPDSTESSTSEKVLGKLALIAAGFDPNARRVVVALLSPLYPMLADWLDDLREQSRELPEKLKNLLPSHSFHYEGGVPEELDAEEELLRVFAKDGALQANLSEYEFRPEQLQMAKVFSQSLENGEVFIAEAGTGIGKSLAYLIPLIIHFSQSGERAIIATYTKTLQTQLFFNDLSLAAKVAGRKLTAAILKGRNNYLCLLKNAMLRSRARATLTPEDFFDLARVEIWESLTKSGDLAEISLENHKVASEIGAEANFCLKQACQFYSRCYFFKARKRAARAAIVVANQALFFSDLQGEGGVMGTRQVAIFDEAHRLEKTATTHLGGELERYFLLSVLNRVHLARSEAETVVNLVEKYLHVHAPESPVPASAFEKIREQTNSARDAVNDLFDRIRQFQTEQGYRAETFPLKLRFDADSELFHLIAPFLEVLRECFKQLDALLTQTYAAILELSLEEDGRVLAEELNRTSGALAEHRQACEILADCIREKYVFWLEISVKGPTRLSFAPLDVSEELDRMIYQKYPAILFTSASLSVEGYFDFFERSIGLDRYCRDRLVRKSFGSSFDFHSQVDFICPVYLSSPKSEYYGGALGKLINFLLPLVRKKSLILFTSHQLLLEIHGMTQAALRRAGFEVFAQSLSGTAEQILKLFRKSDLAVIFGTDSFWEGIDLPGEQLELLLITRLPFSTPSDPLDAARMEILDKKGENAFVSYALPSAVLKFKQGFGRLIRQKSDRGIVLVADSRLVKSNFGQIFLNSIPATLNIVYNQDELMEKLHLL